MARNTRRIGLKRTLGILLCMMLLTSLASAASWPEGTSPAQPYVGRPAADLEKTLGYYMLFPREKAPASYYCDTLKIYLPREDITKGTGNVNIFNGNGELLEVIDISEEGSMDIVPMTEEEMNSLMWGSGVSVQFHLRTSLVKDQSYYVELQPDVLATSQSYTNGPISGPGMWQPFMTSDYGISGRYYTENPEIDLALVGPGYPDDAKEETDETDLIVADQTAVIDHEGKTLNPVAGDHIDFDIFLGGDAVTAVLYCPDNTYYFPQIEFSTKDLDAETGMVHVNGKQTADAPGTLGVFFLDSNGKMIRIVMISGEM